MKELRVKGHLDIDVNDVGRQPAVAVAERLSGESKVSAIYSSDLKRALETEKTISSRCVVLQVIEDINLRERHLGVLQGLVYGQAPKIKTNAYEAIQSCHTNVQIPMNAWRTPVAVGMIKLTMMSTRYMKVKIMALQDLDQSLYKLKACWRTWKNIPAIKGIGCGGGHTIVVTASLMCTEPDSTYKKMCPYSPLRLKREKYVDGNYHIHI